MAAIMFTDIVGYTKLTAENEEKAFQLIKRKRELLLPLLKSILVNWLRKLEMEL